MKKRLLERVLIPLLLLLLGTAGMAQTKTISGRVTDAKDGSPLAGVSVQPKGSALGTSTAADGSFKLSLPDSIHTLLFSSIGFTNKEVAVTGNNVSVSLAALSTNLNEVVVIGYGTAKKKDLTGSVATINAKDFQQGSVTTPEQLISGKVAGVVITSNGGAPGAGSTIRIRGGTSLNASNDPLIVIDGVPLSNDAVSGTANALSLINPNDIASFTVLKDASATAIYGNRASNGVIIITTKGGQSGKLKVNFNSVLSEAVKTNEVKVLTGDQVRQVINKQGTTAQQALLGTANTNWQDQIYQEAFSGDYNLSLTGGIKKLPYRLSLGYTYQDGILKTNNLKRTALGLNLTPSFLNNTLHVNINLKGVIEDNRFANEGAIGAAINMDPTQSVYANNKYGGYFEWLDASGAPIQQATKNPLAQLLMYSSTSTVKRSIGNIKVDYKLPFLPALVANLNAGYDISKSEGNGFVPAYAALNYQQGGSVTQYSQIKRNGVLDFYLFYSKDLKALNSKFDITGGYSYQEFFRGAPGYPNKNVAGTVLSTSLADSSKNTLLSFYGRLNYSFKNRYLLTASLRRDGTSRFSPANRWGTFPSVALAWKLKEESFLKNVTVLTDLKFRAGYGLTGNQDVGSYYPYLPVYTLSSNVAQYPWGGIPYYTYRAEAYDPNIKWETTSSYNAGIDFGLFRDILTGSIDVYYKQTRDLLADIPTAAGANLSNHVLTNVGNIESKGFEFSLNANIINGKNFSWKVGANFTINDNKITKLSKVADSTSPGILTGSIGGGTGNSIQIQTVGYRMNTFYVYKQVYDENGKPEEGLYANVNNNASNLFYRYKAASPKYTIGFTSQFAYKKLDLAFVLRSNIGNYVYNNVKAGGGAYNSISNTLGYIGNANADYLKTGFQNSQYYSDYYVENASFVRMDNITLGYNFGKVLKNTATLRLSAIVQNVFVITKYSGLDPEIYSGIDNNVYPRPRIYSIGINLSY